MYIPQTRHPYTSIYQHFAERAFVAPGKPLRRKLIMKVWWIGTCILLTACWAHGQNPGPDHTDAGYIPVLSGSMGYVHNVDGGVTSLEPQVETVLLVPFGSHVLLESRAEFFGFFQREHQTSGPFTGKVFKSVDYAQLDWLANTHVIATAGAFLLPYGLYNERLAPLWIRNLQDTPITDVIGTRPNGIADGVMLRGNAHETPAYSIQYSAYFSARSSINQLEASRLAGGDASIFLKSARLEVGESYQHLLQEHQINSSGTYVSWQPEKFPLDLKAEFDRSFNGEGYWIEGAYKLSQVPVASSFFSRVQLVPRMQQFHPLNGGGNSLPTKNTQRFDFGVNYYVRDNLRFISSYGRQFSQGANANIWNVGVTYRFIWPLWPGRK
jgi:hypothetical protein